ncbi:MAG: orotidine-5'-phosphate decarboxylase [Veillonellaceae bacterium]|nr:orotidine-5'-phosphate decarboxylase [Veillonellaceae bacterium]
MTDERLIVALDVATREEMAHHVRLLGEAVDFYKVGMELYYSLGSAALTILQEQNKRIFLDLKLHDIPNTVAGGVRSLVSRGVQMLTLHAQGGREMMAAAVAAAGEAAAAAGTERPKLLAVTALTSLSETAWEEIGGRLPLADQVRRLALLAREAGVDGVVASPQEAALIRRECGPEFLIVTPGIRPHFAATNDQARIATPAQALRAGASHLVIGRPITRADDPRQAVQAIVEEMREV